MAESSGRRRYMYEKYMLTSEQCAEIGINRGHCGMEPDELVVSLEGLEKTDAGYLAIMMAECPACGGKGPVAKLQLSKVGKFCKYECGRPWDGELRNYEGRHPWEGQR